MAVSNTQRAYIELHIAVMLFGFTAILGDLIQLPSLVLVWWRVLLTTAIFLLVVNPISLWKKTARVLWFRLMGIGCIVGLHWLAFYGAVKVGNASVTLLAMATSSFFTSLLEPWIMKERFKPLDAGLGLLIIPAMGLIASELDTRLIWGLLLGLVAALLAALFSTLNKKYVHEMDSKSITFIELGSAFLLFSLFMPFFVQSRAELTIWPSPSDWLYLAILVLACTVVAYLLAVRSLRHLSAFASNLTVNLEPLYGIVLAWLILKENQQLNGDKENADSYRVEE